MMTTLGGHIFIIDCSKVEAYKNDPANSAQMLAKRLGAGEVPLMVNTICLGQVTRFEVEGPQLRIYVELDERIEHGTYQGG